MCIGSYLHPSFRTGLLTEEALSTTKQHIMHLVKKLMILDGTIVLPKPDPEGLTPQKSTNITPPTPVGTTPAAPQSRFQQLKQRVSAKLQVSKPACTSPSSPTTETPFKTYEQRLEEAHAHAERTIMTTLFAWETAEFPLPDGQEDFDNMSFWRNMNEFPYLKRVAALFVGRPPSQVEDERHFS